jgi:hypothetical protein
MKSNDIVLRYERKGDEEEYNPSWAESSWRTKRNIIRAGQKAVEELIKVAEEAIVESNDDLAADRLKNAAATKKLAIFDAFEILTRIEEEKAMLEGDKQETKAKSFKGFAEGRSKWVIHKHFMKYCLIT